VPYVDKTLPQPLQSMPARSMAHKGTPILTRLKSLTNEAPA